MGIKELLQKRNDPEGYLQTKMKDIVAELESFKEEVMTSIRKEVEKAKQGIMSADIFLDPAKKIAEQVAREEISSVNVDLSKRIETILEKIDMKAEKAFDKIDTEAEATVEKVSKHLDAITDEFKSNLNGEIAGIKATVENLRGPEGLRGENGIDGKDAQDIDPKSVVPLVLAQIPPVTPDAMIECMNKSTEKINMSVIAGLMQEFQNIKTAISRVNTSKGGGGGGMGAPLHETFACNGVLTTFTLASNVAASGTAIWVRYQGQTLDLDSQYTVSGKVISTTFTPDNGGTISVTYFRT